MLFAHGPVIPPPPPLQVLSYSGTTQLLYHGLDTKFFYLLFGIILTIFALYLGTMQPSTHYSGTMQPFYMLSGYYATLISLCLLYSGTMQPSIHYPEM